MLHSAKHRGQGQRNGRVQDYQDGKGKLHQSCHYDQDKSICQRSNLKEFHWDIVIPSPTKTVIIIIPNKQGRACTWREGCASCAKRKCFPAGGSEPFLNGMMKRLLWLDCYIQEAILEEQFGKLTKKEQKKVHHNCLICMHGHWFKYLNLFKVMDLHWEGEGNPLVAAFRTNCIQG